MLNYKIVPIKNLKPLEKVFPTHLKNLVAAIYKDKKLLHPLIVENKYGVVLDGSHRYVFLLGEGFLEAPVHYVDYSNQFISVGLSRVHRFLLDCSIDISKKKVIQRALSGNLFPPRTTRHFFPFLKEEVNVPLSKLIRKNPVDVSSLVANVRIEEEINHNQKYISEIEKEVEEVVRYLYEAQQTKKYLMQQIREMKKVKG